MWANVLGDGMYNYPLLSFFLGRGGGGHLLRGSQNTRTCHSFRAQQRKVECQYKTRQTNAATLHFQSYGYVICCTHLCLRVRKCVCSVGACMRVYKIVNINVIIKDFQRSDSS